MTQTFMPSVCVQHPIPKGEHERSVVVFFQDSGLLGRERRSRRVGADDRKDSRSTKQRAYCTTF